MTWTHIVGGNAVAKLALKQCKGRYQRGIVQGIENLSGSTLKGKAKGYGAHYARSRRNLLARGCVGHGSRNER